MRRWIRLDAEWEESEWLAVLAGDAAGCWPRLLCWVKLRGKGGRCRFPSAAVLAHQWRVGQSVVEALIAAGLEHEAIQRDGAEIVVVNWEQYQEPNTIRQQRLRDRQTEEASNGESVTERDALSLSMSMSGVAVEGKDPKEGESKRKRAWRFCPEDWSPNEKHVELAAHLRVDLVAEEAKFRDHEFKAPKTDADRAFSRWLRTAKSFGNPLAGRNADPSARLRSNAEQTAEYLRTHLGIA